MRPGAPEAPRGVIVLAAAGPPQISDLCLLAAQAAPADDALDAPVNEIGKLLLGLGEAHGRRGFGEKPDALVMAIARKERTDSENQIHRRLHERK